MPTKILPQDIGSGVDFTISEVSLSDGTAALPSLAFASDQNTGIYRITGDVLAISTNGTQALKIDSDQTVKFVDGAVGTPAITFNSDPTTGFFRTGAGNTRYAAQGVNTVSFINGGLEIASGAIFNQDGSAAAPSLTFNTDQDTGLYRFASNEVSITLGGVERLRVSPGQTRVISTQLGTNSGTAAAPAYTFTNDEDMGMYRGAADTLNFSTAGIYRAGFTSAGQFLINTTGARTFQGITPQVQLEGVSAATSRIVVTRNENVSAGPSIELAKTRGAANGDSTVLQNGDTLGFIFFSGADGTDVDSRAAIIMSSVDGTPGSNDMPGRLEFHTTPDGSATPSERVRITSTGQTQISDGSVALPSLSFLNDTDTGFYRGGANFITVALGASNSMSFAGIGAGSAFLPGINDTFALGSPALGWTQLFMMGGSAAAPSYTFRNDTDTGFFNSGNEINVSCAATEVASFSSTPSVNFLISRPVVSDNLTINLVNSDNTSATSNARVNIQTGGSSGGDPYVRFNTAVTDWSMGIDNSNNDYFVISNNLTLGTNDRLYITPSGLRRGVDGTAGAPAISFISDDDTGIYRGATNFTHFAGGGARVGYIGGNGNSCNFSGVSSTGTHIINTVGTQEGSNTVNSTTRAVDIAGSSKVFVVSTANGDGALCYANFLSGTVTVLGASGTIVASATPAAGQLGIHKSASSHVVNFTTGSSASGTFASWAACAVGASINSVG